MTPPSTAAKWPSSEVPVPKAITGVPWRAQIRTIAATSSVRGDEGHRVGRMALVVGHVLAVLLAHRRRGGKPLADQRADLGDRLARIGRGVVRTGAAAVMAISPSDYRRRACPNAAPGSRGLLRKRPSSAGGRRPETPRLTLPGRIGKPAAARV